MPPVVLIAATLAVVALVAALLRWLELRRARHKEPPVDPVQDPLTRLPNRAWLLDRLGQALVAGRRQGHVVAVLVLGIDRFTSINNRLGHEWGDAVLRRVARRLEEVGRMEDTVTRVDGDRFAILLEHVTDASAPARVAQRILDSFRAPLDLGATEVLISFSIGVAVHFPASEEVSGPELLRDAAMAMERAKQRGKGRFDVFDAQLGRQAVRRLNLAERMREAPSEGEMVLHYQPEVDLWTGRMVGMEALMRWEHPWQGLLFPDQFIPVAEETGLIVPLGRWALGEACRALARMQRQRLVDSDFRLSVNLSVHQLQSDPDLVEQVSETLANNGLGPSSLVVEVTETAQELEPLAPVLEHLRIMGVGVAIDDFGTGYSSLSRLRTLPITVVKIDQRFVRGIRDPANLAIVRSVAGLAEVLGLEVTAEGIEFAHQLELVRSAGCSRGQGYYFSRGVPESDLVALFQHDCLPPAPPPVVAALDVGGKTA